MRQSQLEACLLRQISPLTMGYAADYELVKDGLSWWLTHHKFPRFACKRNEIHALGQVRDIDLLCLADDLARQKDLAHQVGDAVGLVW